MKNAERAVSIIKTLTRLTMALSTLPVLWILAMIAMALVVNPGGGVQLIMEMPLLVLQLLCAAVIIVQTAVRLLERGYVPRVLFVAGAAEVVLTVALMFLADDALEQGIMWLPAVVAAALLTLNSLWSWLEGRMPADMPEVPAQRIPPRRYPFGSRPSTWQGWVALAAEYGLVLICVVSVLPAALWLMIVIAALFSGFSHMETVDWLIHGTMLLCFGSVALSAVRLDGRWWSPWVFFGVEAAFVALMAAEVRLTGDAASGAFVREQNVVMAMQALLHIVWSAAGAREKTRMQ